MIKKLFRDVVRPYIKKSVSVSFLDLYGNGERHLSKYKKSVGRGFCTLISPTWWLASVSGEGMSSDDRTKAVISRNYFYLTVSMILVFVFGSFSNPGLLGRLDWYLLSLFCLWLYIVCWSRCNEILIAFISDALDKTTGLKPQTKLTYRKRIELAFLSYLELIFNFAFLFYLMPFSWFDKQSGKWGNLVDANSDLSVFNNIFDAIYFSGVTITTLGYGDYSPQHWLPKLLVVQQVLVGFTLIVVSFAIYAGRGLAIESSSGGQKNT
ncbi:potassium channel protein [Vibrio maritimus]|uniref:Potassium channel protein n=1 Tax=Vibrio maritimus TaxID=990268 RepID=A0A090RRZ9_9VIBR|nr:potassium channel protein [Vibrio maritimus]